jgi:hypothetical protein
MLSVVEAGRYHNFTIVSFWSGFPLYLLFLPIAIGMHKRMLLQSLTQTQISKDLICKYKAKI